MHHPSQNISQCNLQLGQVKDEDVVTEDALDEGEGDAGFFEDEWCYIPLLKALMYQHVLKFFQIYSALINHRYPMI